MLTIDETSYQRLMNRVECMPENRILDIVFFFKCILACVAFLFVVVVWDTLPSMSPISHVESTQQLIDKQNTKTLKITESYTVVKLVELEINRSLVEQKSNTAVRVHSSRGSYQLGDKSETLLVPVDDLAKGNWCLTRTVSWVNGLSILPQKIELPKKCFEVM